MAITRIKNNQITDVTIVGSEKLVNKSVTSGKLEDNLTYGSNLTVTGNLTVNGSTTTVNSTTVTVDDPMLLLAPDATGSGALDLGFIGERGDDTNIAFVWDESADEFVAAFTSSSDSNTTVTITDYADLRVGGLAADDNVTIGGTLGVTGAVTLSDDISAVNITATGTLDVTGLSSLDGGIDVNGSNFTVATDGGIYSADTLDVDGAATLGSTLGVTGAATLSSTLTVTGATTLNGGVSGDSNAWSIADTTGNISTTGTLNVDGATTLNGAVTLGDAAGDTITITGTATFAESADFDGGFTVAGSQTISMGSNAITNVADPNNAQDAATKNYVDTALQAGFTVSDGVTDQTIDISANDTLTFAGVANETTVAVSATDTVTIGLPDDVNITATLDVGTNATVGGTLDVTGATNFNDTTASSSNTTGAVVIDGGLGLAGNLNMGGNLDVDGTANITGQVDMGAALNVTGLTSLDGGIDMDGVFTVADTTGNVHTDGTLDVDGATTLNDTLAVTGETTLASAIVSDLTDNRVVLAGTSGALEDSANLTFDGSELAVTGTVDVSSNASVGGNLDVTGTLDVTGESTLASATVSDLTDNRIVIAGTAGSLEDDANFTFDGTTLTVGATTITQASGNTDIGGTLDVTGATTLDSTLDVTGAVNINDTTGSTSATTGALIVDGGLGVAENIYAGGNVSVAGNLTVQGTTTTVDSTTVTIADPVYTIGSNTVDDNKDRGTEFKYNDGTAKIGFFGYDDSAGVFTALVDATNTAEVFTGTAADAVFGDITGVDGTFTGNVTVDGTFDVTGQVELGSLNVEDLTDNRIVIAGTDGELEDDANFTFDGTTLTVGATTITQASGNTDIGGTLDVAGLASLDGGIDVDGAFTVADSTGNVSTTGTLAAGNTDITGTLDVSALASLDGGIDVDGAFTVADGSGNVATSGTLEVDGTATFNGSVTLGDANTDSVTFNADVSSNVIPGADSTYDLGSNTDRWANIYVDAATVTDNVTIGGTLGVTGETTLASATVSDLTDNRIVLAGTAGSLEDDANLTYDGTTFKVGTGTTFNVASSNGNTNIDGTLTVGGLSSLDGGIDVDGAFTVADTSGNVSTSGTLTVTGLTTLNGGITADSGVFTVADTTGNVHTGGTMDIDGDTDIGGGNFTVAAATGNTYIAGTLEVDGLAQLDGNVTVAGTFDVTGQTELASLNVEDLTDNRVVIAGADGELEDDANFTFDGTDLNVGQGNFTVAVASGNTAVAGTLDVTGAADFAADVSIADAGTLNIGTGDDFTINHDGTNTAITNSTGLLTIDGTASSAIRVNEAGADVDFIVEGDTKASLFKVDAGTDTVVVGNGTATAGATLAVDATDAFLIAKGTTAQRPGTGAQGMMRYNTTSNNLEYYDGSTWKNMTAEFTVIVADSFNGDGSTVAFTLTNSGTTATTVVSINGVVQLPTTAYAVSGTTLTFTEAPASGDVIDARSLTTTSSVTGIDDGSGTSTIDANGDGTIDVVGNVTITGSLHATGTITADGDLTLGDANTDSIVLNADINSDIIPNTDATYDLGSSTQSWNDVWFGGLVLKAVDADTFAFYKNDGTTPATISSGNVDTTSISQLNSSVAVTDSGSNGTVTFTADGTTAATMTSSTIQFGTNGSGVDIAVGSGNTHVDGTLTIDGASTLTGNVSVGGTLGVTGTTTLGNLTIGSTKTVSMGSNKITNVADPTSAQDAATKAYVDAITSDGSIELGTDTSGNYVATIAGTTNEITVSGSGSETAAVTIGLPDDVTITNDLTVGNDLTVTGNLTVSGTTTTVNTETINLADNIILINSNEAGAPSQNGGIEVERGTSTNVSLVWDETADKWTVGSQTFVASTFEGALTGNVTGNVTGNADTASAWATARTITLGGDLTGNVSIDGSANVTLTATVAANSVALGTDTTGNYVASGATSGNGISGSVSSEGGTFTVTSNATSDNTANTIVYRDASGNFSAGVITGTATAARYADLAEKYAVVEDIEPGTVVCFGGDAEVQVCDHDMDRKVAGVVSTDPAYMMNSELESAVYVALQGRVPCKVVGTVRKGDMMVSAGNGAARAEENPVLGSVIGKALENFDGEEGVIEVVVGRL